MRRYGLQMPKTCPFFFLKVSVEFAAIYLIQ